MSNLANALQELREKRDRAQSEVEKLNQVISGIESLNGIGLSQKALPSTRTVSAASRRKMARAQKARWAGIRKAAKPVVAAKTTGSIPAKRTMSAAARRKISLVQKARWGETEGTIGCTETQTHNFSRRQEANCGGGTCTLGEDTGGEQETGGLVASRVS
jgi:hypothetical protein